jgi:hypothetical protein
MILKQIKSYGNWKLIVNQNDKTKVIKVLATNFHAYIDVKMSLPPSAKDIGSIYINTERLTGEMKRYILRNKKYLYLILEQYKYKQKLEQLELLTDNNLYFIESHIKHLEKMLRMNRKKS